MNHVENNEGFEGTADKSLEIKRCSGFPARAIHGNWLSTPFLKADSWLTRIDGGTRIPQFVCAESQRMVCCGVRRQAVHDIAVAAADGGMDSLFFGKAWYGRNSSQS